MSAKHWLPKLNRRRKQKLSRVAPRRRRPMLEVLEDRLALAAAFALSNGNLLAFDTASPGITTANVAITGVDAGETLVGIDFRPQNGLLYGLGVNSTANTATLYAISIRTAQAGVVGTTGSIAFTTNGTTVVDLPDPATVGYGFDFNPAADRVRVVAGSLNFRVNPNTGAGVDGNNGGAVTTGTNPDGSTSTGTTTVDAAAYTNNQPNGSITTLYTLDASSDKLFIQNPPNVGTQTLGQTVTLGGATLDFNSANGFDIPAGVNVTANNAPVTVGSAFAVLNVGGTTGLYSINLVNAQATFIGTVGNGATPVQGLAIQNDLGGFPAIGFREENLSFQLLRFNTATPAAAFTTSFIGGFNVGELLVGIDFRPQTGQLYGLIVNAAANTATLALFDPQDGNFTRVGTTGQIAFVDGGGNPVDLPDGATIAAEGFYGFDFNPTVDRIRVTTSTGLNFRINPDNGVPVDGNLGGAANSVAGVNTDGAINGSGSTGVSATAYTNSFGQSLTGGVTTQYTLDAALNTLFIQNAPNAGTQTTPVPVTVGGAALDFTDINGFDIPAATQVTASGTQAAGSGFTVLAVGSANSLFQINLTTGVATSLGNVSAQLYGLALGDKPDSADLVVTKPDSPDMVVNEGENITYTLSVANNGPDNAHNVTVTDTVPANTTFANFTAISQGQAIFQGGFITATFGTVITGTTATLSFVVTVDADTPDGTIITNAATAVSTTADPNTANNTGLATTEVNNDPDVSIVANDGSASEHVSPASPDPGQFTVTRTGDTISALTVFYTVVGSAGNGTDYTALTGSVVIGVGQPSAVIDVNVINDALTELPESVVITLSADVAYDLVDPITAFVIIADNEPEVSIVANDASASEHASPAPADPGQFTVTRTGDTTSALTVFYTVVGSASNGTDYTTLTGSVVIGGGMSSAVIDVNVINDALTELPESVFLTLSADAAYRLADPVTAFVVIADNEVDLTITKTDGNTTETAGTPVTYTIVVSNNGPLGVVGATVVDMFPATLSSVNFTSTASGGATGNTSAGTGNINDTVSLPIGSSITYTATGTIDSSATGTFSNTATVNPPAGTTDSNPADNSATDTDTLAVITVTVDGTGKLIIEGTEQDDIVTITGVGTGTGVYLVTTQQGLQPVQMQTVTGVTSDICVNLHAGNDQLTMNNIYINGSIIVDMESGNDTVTLGNTDVVSTKANLDVDLGTENDVLNGKRIFIAGDQILAGGDGNDSMTFNGFASPFTLGTSAAGNANWSTGNGDDTVQVIYAFIVGAFTVDLGVGTDSLNIFGSAASGNVTFIGGAGNDSLSVDTNFFDASLLLDGGADNDTVFLANGLGIDVGTINTGAGDDTVTVQNETQVRANIDTGSGNDTVDVRSSAVDRFFALLGDDDDELTLFGNLLRLEADLDGGAGSGDRLIDLGNDVRGAVRTRNFEFFD